MSDCYCMSQQILSLRNLPTFDVFDYLASDDLVLNPSVSLGTLGRLLMFT